MTPYQLLEMGIARRKQDKKFKFKIVGANYYLLLFRQQLLRTLFQWFPVTVVYFHTFIVLLTQLSTTTAAIRLKKLSFFQTFAASVSICLYFVHGSSAQNISRDLFNCFPID
jgi:hypothetical protein